MRTERGRGGKNENRVFLWPSFFLVGDGLEPSEIPNPGAVSSNLAGGIYMFKLLRLLQLFS
jgi:hypothetical protein